MALQKKMAGSRKSKKLKLRMMNGFKNKKNNEHSTLNVASFRKPQYMRAA